MYEKIKSTTSNASLKKIRDIGKTEIVAEFLTRK
jgi:hypothetical protein